MKLNIPADYQGSTHTIVGKSNPPRVSCTQLPGLGYTAKEEEHPTAWAGDFTLVEPGKTHQISMTFDMSGGKGAKSVDSFRFECQIVVGVVDPATKKVSYSLETIAFDKVTMPGTPDKP